MKTQVTALRKFLVLGAIGIAALAVIGLAASGDESPSEVLPGFAGDDAVYVNGGDGLADVDAALGIPNDRAVAEESAKSSTSGAAVPPVAPNTGSARNGATGGVTTTEPYGGAPAALTDDRKIVQTASMRLEVKEVGASFEEVGRIATGAGGFVASSSFSNQGESQIASVTIRVPSVRYQEVLADLRGLGVKVLSEDSKSSDVTAEYSDLGARLRNLEATELQLLTLLGRAATINEILQVQDRLNSTRGEIEQVKGRMALLDKLTDLATIAVHLQPVAAGVSDGNGGRLGEEIADAWDDSIAFLTDVAAGIVHVIVFAWWVPIVGIPLLLIGSRLLRGRPRPLGSVD